MRLCHVFSVAIVLALCVIPLCYAADRAVEAAADAAEGPTLIKNYQGHRILIWAVDGKTGKLQGFAETTLRQGQSAMLEPVRGYQVQFTLGQAKMSTGALGLSPPKAKVPFVFDAPSMTYNGDRNLKNPDIASVWAYRQVTTASVIFSVPVGTLKSPLVAKLLSVELKGDLGELEDLMIASVQDHSAPAEQPPPESQLQVYDILKQSSRTVQWIALANGNDAEAARVALTIGMRLGNVDATNRFCDRCLKTTELEEMKLIDILADYMPPSGRAMQTMIDLIIDPGIDWFESGSSRGSSASRLSSALTERYPSRQVRLAVQAAIDNAKPEARDQARQRLAQLLELLDRKDATTQPRRDAVP